MSKTLSVNRIALVAGTAALIGLAGSARADCDQAGDGLFTCSVTTTQPCSKNVTGAAAAGYTCPTGETCNLAAPFGSGACYQLRGSDTLFDIMTDSIKNARAASVAGTRDLFYLGSGSGNAENAMKASGGGSQSIGPMSRNMRPASIDGLATVPGASTGTCTGAGCHPAWAASCSAGNILGLDAAVFITNKSGGVNDIIFPTQVNSSATPAVFSQGQKNNIAAATDPTGATGSGFNTPSANINYTSLWSIALAGVDGTGSLAACSDPRRVKAVQDLAQNMGVTTINHFYRRDDNSGTTDTIKDRVLVVDSLPPQDSRYPFTGGRFCNGLSIGGISGTTLQQGKCSTTRGQACTKDLDCALPADGGTCASCLAGSTERCWFNLNNQDLDPLRRPCTDDATVNGLAYTSCTDLTTGLSCQPADNNPNCSQGLVVALSDTDFMNTNQNGGVGAGGAPPTDVTTSIAKRVGFGGGGKNAGYAGRESANASTFSTKAIKVNGVASSDGNVRNSAYMLARKLFLQNAGDPGTFTGADLLTDGAAGANGVIGGLTQRGAEQALFGYMRSRTNTDPVVSKFNFITCLPDPTQNACTAPNNLCGTPANAVAPAFGGLNPTANGAAILSNGNLAGPPGGTRVACSGSQRCIANGYLCNGTDVNNQPVNVGSCDPIPARPAFSACWQTTDCASGLTCQDALGLGLTTGGKVCH